MQPLRRTDFLRRLRSVGVAGAVQASEVQQAFALFMQSEFPNVAPNTATAAFVRHQELTIRCRSAAVAHVLREREIEVCQYLSAATGQTITGLHFRV